MYINHIRPPDRNSAQWPSLAGVRTLVVGLGRFGGGVGVTQWLARQGAVVTVTDQAPAESLAESLSAIADLPVTLCLGGHESVDLGHLDLAVINPAVHKPTSVLFQKICHQKTPWTTEINLFCERCPAPVIAVTGSYGKSTTAAMLAHVLQALGGTTGFSDVHLGGNIGRSLLVELPFIRPEDLVILELSNAQLEDIPRIDWNPEVAVITNLFPHHLDRYESFEGYINAKLNLVRAGNADCPVIHGQMDPQALGILKEAATADRLLPVEEEGPIPLAIPGSHNQLNAACVLTVCRTIGLDEQTARAALRTFPGLPHRLELVGEFGGVTYINDSKSTAPAATISALEAMRERHGRLVVIVGGQKKDELLEECARSLVENARVVICYGQSGPQFAEAIANVQRSKSSNVQAPLENACRVLVVADVVQAASLARKEARAGDTVLFSPGAPSFDQYANFTERGKRFAALIRPLQP